TVVVVLDKSGPVRPARRNQKFTAGACGPAGAVVAQGWRTAIIYGVKYAITGCGRIPLILDPCHAAFGVDERTIVPGGDPHPSGDAGQPLGLHGQRAGYASQEGIERIGDIAAQARAGKIALNTDDPFRVELVIATQLAAVNSAI